MATFSADELAFIKVLKTDGKLLSADLMTKLGWEKDRFDAVKEVLRSRCVIDVVRGRFGGITLNTDDKFIDAPAAVVIDVSADEPVFVEALKSFDGHRTSSVNLMTKLGWEKDRFDAVKEALREKTIITIVKGKFGGINLTESMAVQEATEEFDTAADEPVFLEALKDGQKYFSNDLMTKLGWEKDRFNAVKEVLREKGQIAITKGKFGGISLATDAAGEIEDDEADAGVLSIRLNNEWRISADPLQLLLQKKGSAGWVSQSYVAVLKHVLVRDIEDRGIQVVETAKKQLDALPDVFGGRDHLNVLKAAVGEN